MKGSAKGYRFLQVILGLLIAAALLLLIRGAILKPGPAAMNLQANEASAIESLRSIYQSEIQYQTNYPANGFLCSLQALGSDSTLNPTLDGAVSGGQKNGYLFNIVNCTKTKITVNGHALYTGFEATAVPQPLGRSRQRGFCIDREGEVRVDPSGGAHCREALH